MLGKNASSKQDAILLTPNDLFDRIINVRLNMVNPSAENKTDRILDSIVIRSDFEIVYENLKITNLLRTLELPSSGYYIQKCTFKPSIKVQYKRLSGNIAVQIDVFIDNFYALSKDNKFLAQFNAKNYKVSTVDIMLGYFGQFAAFQPVDATTYMSFTPPVGVTLLKGCQVLYVTQDKLPPNGTLHITAVVGTVTKAPVDTKAKFPLKYSLLPPTGLLKTYSLEKKSIIDIFFDNITRRFCKSASLDSKTFAALITDPVTGLMNVAGAKLVGVECVLSPEAMKVKIGSLKDSEGKEIPNKLLSIDTQSDLLSCFNQINTTLFSGQLQATMLNDGSLLIFTKDEISNTEKSEKLMQLLKLKYSVESPVLFYQNRLPAVYNIVTGVTSEIICPFFFLVSPFQEIRFKNRYATGSAVAYFTDFTTHESVFYALSMSVSFATVDDINEMTINCITRKE